MILSEKNVNQTSFIVLIFILPMWMNFLLRTLAWQNLLEKNGVINMILHFFHLPDLTLINTPGAIILGMVYNFLPFMILPLYTTLEKLDNSYLEAAADLGGNKFTVFTRVTFPLSMPGVISGITMVFMPSMTNYVVSDTLGNFNITILGKLIDQYFTTYDNWHMGSMISIILLVIIFLTMLLTGRFKDETRDARGANLW